MFPTSKVEALRGLNVAVCHTSIGLHSRWEETRLVPPISTPPLALISKIFTSPTRREHAMARYFNAASSADHCGFATTQERTAEAPAEPLPSEPPAAQYRTSFRGHFWHTTTQHLYISDTFLIYHFQNTRIPTRCTGLSIGLSLHARSPLNLTRQFLLGYSPIRSFVYFQLQFEHALTSHHQFYSHYINTALSPGDVHNRRFEGPPKVSSIALRCSVHN